MNQNVWPVWWCGFVRIVHTELQGCCNSVVCVEVCSHVCPYWQQSAVFAVSIPNEKHCWYTKPMAGATVTVCNKRQHINQWLHLYSFSNVVCKLFDHLPCSDNTSFKSAWQNWNKLDKKKCRVCGPLNLPSTSTCRFFLQNLNNSLTPQTTFSTTTLLFLMLLLLSTKKGFLRLVLENRHFTHSAWSLTDIGLFTMQAGAG